MILNSIAEWRNGYCVGEKDKDLDVPKKLQGDVKTGKYARDECAVLCSEDRRTTACEYDIVKKTCTVHTESVTSYFTPPGVDNNKRCSIILPKGMTHL